MAKVNIKPSNLVEEALRLISIKMFYECSRNTLDMNDKLLIYRFYTLILIKMKIFVLVFILGLAIA